MPTMEEQESAMIANLADKTGRNYDDWAELLAGRKGHKHGELVAALKAHGLGHGYADAVARRFRTNGSGPGSSTSNGGDLLDALFSPKKAGLRPVHEALVGVAHEMGADVDIQPKKTYVSFRRGKQFALTVPSTASRLDLGLRLPDVAATDRLEVAGSFNNTVSHRVRLSEAADVDGEVIGWLTLAYELAG